MKRCPTCKVEKPYSGFHKNKAAPDGYQWHCIECRIAIDRRPWKREYDKNRYHTQKETAYLDPYYRRVYNISLDDYKVLLAKQNGTCAICQQVCSSGRRLAVDHCHKTQKVRGLLCGSCNQAIGLLKDNKEIMQSAIKYLEKAYS